MPHADVHVHLSRPDSLTLASFQPPFSRMSQQSASRLSRSGVQD